MSYLGDDSASPKGKSTFPRQRGLKIFVSGIRHGFKSGDWIVVRRNGAILHEGSIGEPKVYDRLIVHTELSFDAWRGDGNG